MREAYLVNNSQSIASIPLYERRPVTVRGRTVQGIQYKKLVPNEEFVLGVNISAEKKAHYQQFKSIMIELKFREAKPVIPTDENPNDGEVEDKKESEDKRPEVVYNEESLMKMRQAELITIAEGLGLEATTQNSKAEITKMILEKSVG